MGGHRRRAHGPLPRPVDAGRSDLCYATTNRQAALRGRRPALRRRRRHRLGELARTPSPSRRSPTAAGCRRVLRVNSAERAAGRPRPASSASPPAPRRRTGSCRRSSTASPRRTASRSCTTVDEDEYFPPPPELRDLLRCLSLAAGISLGATGERDVSSRRPPGDRRRHADRGHERHGVVNARAERRRRQLDELVDKVALEEFEPPTDRSKLAPVAVVIAAYKEVDNISEVVRSACRSSSAASPSRSSSSSTARRTARRRGALRGPSRRVSPRSTAARGRASPRLPGRALTTGRATSSPPTPTARPTPTTSRSPWSRSLPARPTSSTVRDASARPMSQTSSATSASSCSPSSSRFSRKTRHRHGEPDAGHAAELTARAHPRGAAVPGLGAADRRDHARLSLRGTSRHLAARAEVTRRRAATSSTATAMAASCCGPISAERARRR